MSHGWKKGDLDLFRLIGDRGLSAEAIRELAFETGFCQRASGKIDAPDFVVHLCLESLKGTVSHNDLAARLATHTGVSASRQACWQRTTEPCVRFFQGILERVMLGSCPSAELEQLRNGGRFQRVLLQDSTVIQLPLRLFAIFSGVRNADTAVCNARIQGVYDLLSGQFIHFSVDPYSRNDQAATFDLPVEPGDLVLRDRGYFVLEAIAEQQRRGADSINRYKHGTALFDPDTGQKINLLDELSPSGSLDREVLAGPDKSLKLRLLAVPVDEETANLRRMNAKRQTKGHAPSEELLKLMSWTIFLTTLSDPKITFREILALCGLRWRIENIFKTWKSHFSFAKVHNVSETQLRVLLAARLILITVLYHRLYRPLSRRIKDTEGLQLSLMKLMHYVSRNLDIVPELLDHGTGAGRLYRVVVRYCTYEKRRRPDFVAKMRHILLDIRVIHDLGGRACLPGGRGQSHRPASASE